MLQRWCKSSAPLQMSWISGDISEGEVETCCSSVLLVHENARISSLSFLRLQEVVLSCSLVFLGRYKITSQIPPHMHQPRCGCKHILGLVVMENSLRNSLHIKLVPSGVLHQHMCLEHHVAVITCLSHLALWIHFAMWQNGCHFWHYAIVRKWLESSEMMKLGFIILIECPQLCILWER